MIDTVGFLLEQYKDLHGSQQLEKNDLSLQIGKLLSLSSGSLTPSEMDQVPRIYKYAQMLKRSIVSETTINHLNSQNHPLSTLFYKYRILDNPQDPVFTFSIDGIYWMITVDQQSITLGKSVPWFVSQDGLDVTSTVQWNSYGIVMYIAVNEYIKNFYGSFLTTGRIFDGKLAAQVWSQLYKIWLAKELFPCQLLSFTQSIYDHKIYKYLLDQWLLSR